MTPKEYFKLLVDTSKSGGFPAVKFEKGGGLLGCCYLGDGGLRCAIGLLLPRDVAEAFNDKGAIKSFNYGDFQPHLPKWLTLDDAIAIQKAHDSLQDLWHHDDFVAELRKVPIFKGF